MPPQLQSCKLQNALLLMRGSRCFFFVYAELLRKLAELISDLGGLLP